MKTLVYSTRPSTQKTFEKANAKFSHNFTFIEPRLTVETAALASGYDAVCLFVNDVADQPALDALSKAGVKLIALRAAGFNNVDVRYAHKLGICVCRVPAYSPYAVAEHAVTLILALNRKIHRAYARVREGNFSLEGLLGFDLHGKTVGIIGTGKIGTITANILKGFGCTIIAADPYENNEIKSIGKYVEIPELIKTADIISLHCPLTPESKHLMNMQTFMEMKKGAMLINTSRGALVDAKAAIAALKTKRLGYLGLDVYEEEADLFFEDLSDSIIQDDLFARLTTFPNVIITAHQAFFTDTALINIAETTLENIAAFEKSGTCQNIALTDSMRRSGADGTK